jgi:hypothetical protein
LIAAGIMTASKLKKISLVIGLPLAISCMHICWGSGFLWSMIVGVFTAQLREKA